MAQVKITVRPTGLIEWKLPKAALSWSMPTAHLTTSPGSPPSRFAAAVEALINPFATERTAGSDFRLPRPR